VEWIQIVRRYRIPVIGCALAGLALATLVSMFAKPKYRATNDLELQALNQDFMNLKSLLPSTMAGSFSTETNVQTQVHIIDSPLNLLRTKVRLMAEEQGRVSRPQNLVQSWFASMNLFETGTVPTKNLVNGAVRSLKVKSVGPSRLIEIQAESTDPELAAKTAMEKRKRFW